MRNVEIFVCLVLVLGVFVFLCAAGRKEDVVTASADISVKEALFGTEQEEQKVAQKKEEMSLPEEAGATTEQPFTGQQVTEQVTTQQALTETLLVEDETETPVEEPEGPFEQKCIANVEETLNIRKEASTDSDFVGLMCAGAIAIVEGSEGEWTKIKSGDVEGYVLTDYVLTGKEAEQFAADYVTLRGTVLEDGVNVRSEKSTDAEIVTVLDKDATLTVVDEKFDAEETEAFSPEEEVVTVNATKENEKEITWLSVELEDGQTGYVSADLVNVEELYEIAVSAEELERQAAEEEAARIAAEEEAARQAAEEAAASYSPQTDSSSSDSYEDYQGASTEPVTATESGDCIGTFTITAYCGCKQCSGGHNKTATGTTPTEGRTIAADTSILPYGTQVVIDGIVYTVEDCGSGVNGMHIDIFFATHERALAFGRKSMKVYRY